MKKAAAIAMAVLLTAVLAGCGSKTDYGAGKPGGVPAASPTPTAGASASPGTPPTVSAAPGTAAGTVDAQAVFKQNCISCHGANLEGKVGGNSNLQKVGARRSKEQIVQRITNGGNGMIPFGGRLRDEEINALADWLSGKK